MKKISAYLPIALLVALTVGSIAMCYYKTVYEGSVPVSESEEVR